MWGEFRSLIALGDVLLGQKQWERASGRYQEALVFQQKYQYSHFVASLLEGQAQLALISGDSLSSARLLGAAQKRRDLNEISRFFHQEAVYQLSLAALHEQLTDSAMTKAWMEGYSMSTSEAIAYALATNPSEV